MVKVVNDLLCTSDTGHVSILAMLDLSAAFDTLDHEILIDRFATTFGCSGCVLRWFRSYLSERTQSVAIDEFVSAPSTLKYGVPQGSVLGPVMFAMYVYPLGQVIKPFDLSYHFYADDTQLYDHAVPLEAPRLAAKVSCAIADVYSWSGRNGLKMNEEKTEIIRIGSKSNLAKFTGPESITVINCQVPFVNKVRNLGVLLDPTLSFDLHISQMCRGLYLQLRRLGQIRPYLSNDSAKTLAVALILSRIDYCNALLAGLPEDKIARLQRIQNSTARLVMCRSKRDSGTALLRSLHWLPVKARIEYKVALLCHQCIFNNKFPSYLKALITPYVPQRTLRSANSSLLEEPRFSLTTVGLRAFSVSGPKVWNLLPIQLRQTSSIDSFKKNLKTHYFNIYLN